MAQGDNEKRDGIPRSNSFPYDNHPLYITNPVYGIEDCSSADGLQEESKEEDSGDQPIESWGWVNNVE